MKIFESPGRDFLRILFWYPIRWTVIILPFPLAIKLLSLLGCLHHAVSRGKKALIKNNLTAMGIDDEDAVKEYFINHYVDQLFILVAPKLNKNNIDKWVHFEGLQHLDDALKNNKGIILIHGHFGQAHMPLVALAHKGYNMKQVGNPSDEGLSWVGRYVAFRLRMKYEAKMPAEIMGATSFMRPVFDCLKQNAVVMMTGDGSGRDELIGRHTEVPFMNHRVMFPLGPAILSNKTGATLIPMFVLPGENKMFHVIIDPPLYQPAAKDDFDPAPLAAEFARHYEKYIRKAPGYIHFLDRMSKGVWVKGVIEQE